MNATKTTLEAGNPSTEPVLMTVDEAARFLRVQESYLYRHASELKFVTRIGRTLRINRAALMAYLGLDGAQ